MSKVKQENYIVIQGWMLTDLELKGNELIVYAIIYGFSQNGEGQHYIGSLQYLADWTNSTKQGVIKNLKSLIDKGLIAKEEKFINGVKFCEYYATLFNTPMQQSLTGGMQQSLTNNIDHNNTIENNNIDNKQEPKKSPKKKDQKEEEPKTPYGETYQNVMLTEKEYKTLIAEFGDTGKKAIEFLDLYIEETGYKRKSHYLSIRRWVINAVNEQEQKQQRASRSNNPANTPAKNNRFNNFEGRNNNLEAMVWENFRKKQENPPKTAAEDEGIRARAEALKKQFV